MNQPTVSDQQKLDPATKPATDDLTIAEHIKGMRRDWSGEGEVVYLDGDSAPVRIAEHKAKDFIEEFGPLHPGDYRAEYKSDWREDFRKLAD